MALSGTFARRYFAFALAASNKTSSHHIFSLMKHPEYICVQQCRLASWKTKMAEKKKLKNIVHQYASENTKRSERVYVWGYAAVGALGVSSFVRPKEYKRPRRLQLTPYRLSFIDDMRMKVYAAACGYGFTVFLCDTESGPKAYGTGINLNSQLGYQEYPPNSGRILDYIIEPVVIDLPLEYKDTKPTHVACGRAHTVIATDKEGIFTLGNNALGQCARPVIDKEQYWASHTVNKVPFDKKVKQVECGQDHTLVLTEDGHVYGCGLGADGQTAQGNDDVCWELKQVTGDINGEKIVHLSSRADTILAVSEKGDLFGWGNCEYDQFSQSGVDTMAVNIPQHLKLDNVGKVAKAAACGTMCALVNTKGQVFVWGFGILGRGPKVDRSAIPLQLPETLFGKNEFSPDGKIVDINCCMNSFIATTDDGHLYGWGKNKAGNLGLGHNLDQFFPIKIIVPAEVKKVACGIDHAVVLSTSHA